MALCYNFTTASSAIITPTLYDDLMTFTFIPYLDEYTKHREIEDAVRDGLKEIQDMHEDLRPILLGYVKENNFHHIYENESNSSPCIDSHEVEIIQNFVKSLRNKEFPEILPEFIVFKCFPYCIDLPLHYGYVVNKYTEISKYDMYLFNKCQFVLVTELEFDFEDSSAIDVLTDKFLDKLVMTK